MVKSCAGAPCPSGGAPVDEGGRPPSERGYLVAAACCLVQDEPSALGIPYEVPDDPQAAGEEIGIHDGCISAFEELPTDYGEHSSTAKRRSTNLVPVSRRMKRVHYLSVVGALLLLSSAGAAVAQHVEEVATLDDVVATFSFDVTSGGFRYSNRHLTIEREGSVLFDRPIRPLATGDGAWPAGQGRSKSVFVADLDGDGEPEVFLELYMGGAHCCWYTRVFRYRLSTNGYTPTRQVWWNPGVRRADLDDDGLPEFVSGDNRFAYEFSCFACSRWPPQIWIYRSGRFIDVTRRFSAKVWQDARREWREALRSRPLRQDNSGPLAAWIGDKCLLGECRQAWRRLETWRRHGWIHPGWDDTPRAYLSHLRKFLRRTGYWD